MIVTRTPFRISFAGGGSDLPSFYRNQPGAVVAAAIDKYVYITINKNFDSGIRLKYSEFEEVDKPEDIKHDLIRESFKLMDIKGGLEITSLADIPVRGTGLGSSSSYLVGVINALNSYLGKQFSSSEVAEKACYVEMVSLNRPVGKQDQYTAAFGGMNFISFMPDGEVVVEPLNLNKGFIQALQSHLIMFYTGINRDASNILSVQSKNFEENVKITEQMKQMVRLAEILKDNLKAGKLENFGRILDENWTLKKEMAKGVSSGQIDNWYELAKKAGAEGGKILGAGGGGFLLFFAPPDRHPAIISALRELKKFDFNFEPKGSIVVNMKEI